VESDIPNPPKFEYRIITADTAQKTNEWNDWTVFAEWGIYQNKIYRLAYYRERLTAKDLRKDFEVFVKESFSKNSGLNGNLRKVLVEDKSSGTGLIQEVEGKLPIKVTPVPRERDKVTRGMDAQPHHADKKVCLPYNDSYNYEMISEVAAFSHDDSHKHDDQTDVMIDAIEEVFIKPFTDKKPSAGVLRGSRHGKK